MNLSKKFKDAKERDWTINITWGTATRLHDEAAFDISQLIRDPDVSTNKKPTDADAQKLIEPYTALVTNPYKLLNVIGSILLPDIKAAGITVADFFEGIAGETLPLARDAFTQALFDFFPKDSLKRQLLEGVTMAGKKTEEAMAVAAKRAGKEFKKLEALDVEKMAEDAIGKALLEASTNSPASSELIRTLSP